MVSVSRMFLSAGHALLGSCVYSEGARDGGKCFIHPRSAKPLTDCPPRLLQLKVNVEKLIGISGLWINRALHLGIVSSEEGQFTLTTIH